VRIDDVRIDDVRIDLNSEMNGARTALSPRLAREAGSPLEAEGMMTRARAWRRANGQSDCHTFSRDSPIHDSVASDGYPHTRVEFHGMECLRSVNCNTDVKRATLLLTPNLDSHARDRLCTFGHLPYFLFTHDPTHTYVTFLPA